MKLRDQRRGPAVHERVGGQDGLSPGMVGRAIGELIWSWLSRPAHVDPLLLGVELSAVGAAFGFVAGLCYSFAAAVFPVWAAALVAVTCLGILTHATHPRDSDDDGSSAATLVHLVGIAVKFFAVVAIGLGGSPFVGVFGALIVAASFSRAVPAVLSIVVPAPGAFLPSQKDVAGAVGLAVLVAVLVFSLFGWRAVTIPLCFGLLSGVGVGAIAARRPDFTRGEVLGVAQQVAETAVLVSFAATLAAG